MLTSPVVLSVPTPSLLLSHVGQQTHSLSNGLAFLSSISEVIYYRSYKQSSANGI